MGAMFIWIISTIYLMEKNPLHIFFARVVSGAREALILVLLDISSRSTKLNGGFHEVACSVEC